jgi:hypothetical protein
MYVKQTRCLEVEDDDKKKKKKRMKERKKLEQKERRKDSKIYTGCLYVCIVCSYIQVFQAESAILRENILWVQLHRHNQKCLYPKLNV